MSKMSKAIAALGVVAGLGVAALPLSSYAVADISKTATTTAQAIVGDSIAITADALVTMSDVQAGQEANEASATIKVQTNNANGYSVSLKDSNTDTALKTTDGTGTATGIPAGIPAKNTNAWGFKSSSSASNVQITAEEAAYRKITKDPQTIATGTAASANEGDIITLTFGVTVDTTIAAGTYQDDVTLTATTN